MIAARAAFIDPFRDYGEVDADLTTIEEWAAANGVAKVDGMIRLADVAFARSKAGLPRFNVVPRALGGAPARPDEAVEVDTAEMVAWAKGAKLALNRNESIINQVNAARASLGLPRMRLKGKPAAPKVELLNKPPAMLNSPRTAAAPSPETALPAPPARSIPASDACPAGSEPPVAPLPDALPIAANETELLNLVTTHSGTVTGLVTPEIAGWLLSLNTNNRPMSDRGIDRFIKILKRGAWQNTGEAVIVSREGVLSDGQHRLTAIKRSGVAAECDVRFGIPRAAFAATGTGARRTTGNALAIAGRPHATMQAAIGRLIVQFDAGCIHLHTVQVESDLVITATDTEPAIGAAAALIQPLKFKPARTAPFGFALVLAARAASLDQATAFAHLVDAGRAEETDATRRLHVRLRDAAMNKERLSQIDVAILTVRAWNAWIAGRPIQVLKATEADRADGGFPKVLGG